MYNRLLTTWKLKGVWAMLGLSLLFSVGCTDRDLKVSFFKSLDTSITARVTAPSAEAGVWKAIPVRIELSEAVQDLALLDVQVHRGSIVEQLPDSEHPDRVLHLKVDTDFAVEERGDLSIEVPLQQVQLRELNAQGEPRSESVRQTRRTIPIYRKKNTVKLMSGPETHVNREFTVQAEFQRAVQSFSLSNITVLNGVASDLTGDERNYSFSVTPTNDGEVQVSIADSVTLDDLENPNAAAEPNVSKVFDGTAPVITITELNPSGPIYYKNQKWSWSCDEPCTFLHQVTSSATSSLDAQGNFSNTLQVEKNDGTGTFYLHLMAKDAAGNLSTKMATVLLDNTAPTAPSIYSSGMVFSKYSYKTPYITFVPGVDVDSDIQRHEARVKINETTYTEWAPFSAGEMTLTGQVLGNAQFYTFELRAVDNAGNVSSVATKMWTTDFVAPAAPAGVTLGEVPFSLEETPVISWPDTTDAGSGVRDYELRITESSGVEVIPWTLATSGHKQPLSSPLTNGTNYLVYVRATDNVGNVSAESIATSWKARECPLNYIRVKPVADYTAKEFCVAKYEMSLDAGNNAQSLAVLPKDSINQTTAVSKCRAIGDGASYDLISNNQWQAVAHTIEKDQRNWSGGVVGTGTLPNGFSSSHPNSAAPSTDDLNGCVSGGCPGERRTLHLGDGIIWDFAGNLWEWVRDTRVGLLGSLLNPSATAWYSWDPSESVFSLITSILSGPSLETVRKLFYTEEYVTGGGYLQGGTATGIIRGGNFGDGLRSGIYATNLNNALTAATPFIGFRCVMESDPR